MKELLTSSLKAAAAVGNRENIVYIISSDIKELSFFESSFDTGRASVALLACPDWNGCLSPWPAPACFSGESAFSGGAPAFVQAVAEAISEMEAALGLSPAVRAIAGYSLAGLFALYAFFETDLFRRAASVSGSLWYDGFMEYLRQQNKRPCHERVYLSVGDREARTRNARLKTVEENTRAAQEIFRALSIPAAFHLNPGNHFSEPEIRLLRAVSALFP